MNKISEQLKILFQGWAGELVESVTPLPDSGSYRKYFRIKSKNKIAVGVYNPFPKENNAFISFTKHFLNKELNVPRLYLEDPKKNIYLIQDLGNKTLFDLATENSTEELFISNVLNYYKSALKHLIRFQIEGGKDLDYSFCYPRKNFDKQSVMWDLNYFKYYFLKLYKINFDEQLLENDFNKLTEYLLTADMDYFLYRDFQARNIIIHNHELYFIDYQGGRKGALQYDVASLLMQAKVNLSSFIRNDLLDYYLTELNKHIIVKRQDFIQFYYSFALIRILQTLGAYGFRGVHEKKVHFIKSIPNAVNNLKMLLNTDPFISNLPELLNALIRICDLKEFADVKKEEALDKLTVTINSFSYRDEIPLDYSGNGGGFVFDCRPLDNPGRFEKFKDLTGNDYEVIKFLSGRSDVLKFLQDVYSIVDRAVENYNTRQFANLMVSFGCTGGQHRSVYCAHKLKDHLKEKFDVLVKLDHTRLNKMEEKQCRL